MLSSLLTKAKIKTKTNNSNNNNKQQKENNQEGWGEGEDFGEREDFKLVFKSKSCHIHIVIHRVDRHDDISDIDLFI